MLVWRNMELEEIRELQLSQPKGDSRRMIGLAHSYRRNYRRNQRVKALVHYGDLVSMAMYGFVMKKQELNLLAIATLDAHKNKGYGSIMLEIIRREAIAQGMLFFKFEADKFPARDWYKNRGFVFMDDNPMRTYQDITHLPAIEIPNYRDEA